MHTFELKTPENTNFKNQPLLIWMLLSLNKSSHIVCSAKTVTPEVQIRVDLEVTESAPPGVAVRVVPGLPVRPDDAAVLVGVAVRLAEVPRVAAGEHLGKRFKSLGTKLPFGCWL